MDATVTIKATPDEHRLIRRSIENRIMTITEELRRASVNPREKQELRGEAHDLGLILEKI